MSLPLIRQGYYPKDDDYYVILNVDFNASQETITSSYRNLARRFHPDKNNQDDRSQREAELIFQKIKTAYDVLSDPHKRKIYDTLGPDGLKLESLQMVRKQMTADEIRDEFLRLQKGIIEDKFAAVAKPRSSFTIFINASEMFRKSEDISDDVEDGEEEFEDERVNSFLEAFQKLEVRSLSASMSVDNNIAVNHNLTLMGNLQTQNGVGDGGFGSIYRYKYSPATQFTGLLQFGRGPIVSLGIDHKLTDKTTVSGRGILIFNSYMVIPSAKLFIAHKLRDDILGKITYREGLNSSVTTALVYVNEKLMLEITTSYKLSQISQTASMQVAYKFNNDKSKLSVALVGSSNEGPTLEYGCETRVFAINTIGAALCLSLPNGITLKLRFSRANQEFNVPIYISDEVTSAPVFYGTIAPLLAFYIVDRCYLKYHKQSR